MRPSARQSTAVLGILLPLAALAWIGSVELSRQSARAEQALSDHASTFLRDASRLLETELSRLTSGIEDRLEIEFRPLVVVEEESLRDQPLANGLLAINADGELVYPIAPPYDDEFQLPFTRFEPLAEVRTAEQLIALEDFDGAREVLEELLRTGSRRGGRSARSRPRAHFRLATVMRRLGDLDAAELHFVAADRSRFMSREPGTAAIELLCDLGLAEVDALRSGTPARIVDTMQRIANGEHYVDVPDAMLAEVMLYLDEQVPGDSADSDAATAALDLDAARRAGRQFAADYRSFSRESVRRQLRARTGDRQFVAFHDGADVRALLALRPLDDAERDQALGTLDDAAWIGMWFEIEPLLRRALEPLLVPTTEAFYLAIESPNSTPILPRDAAPTDEDAGLLPAHRSIAGLILRAAPADPTAFLEQRDASIRNRALLIAALCVAALGATLLLIRSVARESELAGLKLTLVSRVSHELKTPLALIKMYAETLERGRTTSPEQTAKFSAIISREADRLTSMIQRVLDFSRRESGEAEFHPTDTDLSEVTEAVTIAYRPNAAARDVEVSLTVSPGLVARVDRDAYESAVLNLIDNAVKYSSVKRRRSAEAGEKHVEVTLSAVDGSATLEVADRGIGVANDELERIFESFYRGQNAGEAPGAGLGLSLVRTFAEGHGGTVKARPRDGGGTILRLDLPLLSEHA